MRSIHLLPALFVAGVVALCAPAARAATSDQTRYQSAYQDVAPGQLCRAAIEVVERSTGIPSRLLAAIGHVESGRPDATTGEWLPWPWTIDVNGAGHFYETKAQAIAAVRKYQAQGERSIDVGCMQVNLSYHPTAFANLDEAFDPRSNAAYAAHFLTVLYGMSHDWTQAAAMYHSATPALGAAYRNRVLAVWPEEKRHRGPNFAASLRVAGGSGTAAQVAPVQQGLVQPDFAYAVSRVGRDGMIAPSRNAMSLAPILPERRPYRQAAR